MPSSSSALPLLPLEVQHDILRFCDPSTLAKTAQVSLAFLELSSPLLYEDVHVEGIEALKSLFSNRDQPPSLSITPFLSLSQIQTLTISLSTQHLRESSETLQDLSLDRSPSGSPLLLQNVQISVIAQEGDMLPSPPGQCEISLPPLVRLLDPLHLSLLAPLSPLVLYVEVEDIFPWTRLESLTFDTISTASPLFRPWSRAQPFVGRFHPRLVLVTYQLNQVDTDELVHDDRVECMLGNLPMPEGVQVVVVVGTEEARSKVLVDLREMGEARGDPSSWKKVLAQVTVEVKQRS